MKQRIVGLDILRISLALLIFLFHSKCHFQCSYGVFDNFIGMGAIAMTAFFMLSGYSLSISNSFEVLNIYNLKKFYLKRLIAIVPLYMFIHFVRMFIWNNEPISNRLLMFPVQTLGIQSQFSTLFNHAHNGGSWFISCLLACYFVFPLISVLLSSLSNKHTILVLFLLVFIMLWSLIVQIKVGTNSIYDNPFFRCVEFSIGMLLYNINNHWKETKIINIISNWAVIFLSLLVLVAGVTIFVKIGIPQDFMLYNWVALPCFVLLILALGNKYMNRFQNSSFIKYASSISFTFFLAQMLALWIISKNIVDLIGYDNNIVRIIIYFIVCTVVAILLHEIIEVKASKYLKSKLLK